MEKLIKEFAASQHITSKKRVESMVKTVKGSQYLNKEDKKLIEEIWAGVQLIRAGA
jgi:hypothetical protein